MHTCPLCGLSHTAQTSCALAAYRAVAEASQPAPNASTRLAFAQAFQPLYTMRRRILGCFAVGLLLSAILLLRVFGVPAEGFGWHPIDQPGDSVRVVLVLAPGLLVLLPLLVPDMRRLANDCPAVRRYRSRVAMALFSAWCIALAAWEGLSNLEALEGFAPLPGHTLPSAVLPAFTGVAAVVSVSMMIWEPPVLVGRWRYLIWKRIAYPAVIPLVAVLFLLIGQSQPPGWPP